MATAITLDANESGAASVPTVPISVRAHPDPAVAAKCDSLVRAGLGEKTYYPADEVYQTRNSRYWSLEAQKLTPYCIVQPESAADVAAAVTAIVATEGLNFAIRSGGHVMWGASNIDNGVTIDLGRLNTTTYNKETNVVSIGPGCRWADVYAVIEPQGVVVSGGRDGDVGVGGLMTGGGKSWYSPRYGWACDSLVGAEVVLADGRVLEVSKDQHADLWTALKGGSGNFGIVTRFDVQAIPAEPVWAGILFANTSTDEQQIQALVNFNKCMNEGHNSSWIVVWQYLPMFKDVVATRFVANTAGQHNPPELQETLAIPTIAGEMTNMTMTEMAVMSEQPYGFQ
jgi:FAD/FMN-containing dehydrogenase